MGEEPAIDGGGKGHTNLIGDSSLTTDIKQGQKKVTSSNTKPLLQLKRQNIQQSSGDNFIDDQIEKGKNKDRNDMGNDVTSSRSPTPNMLLAAGNAEKAFFNVCLVGNGNEVKCKEDNVESKYSRDVGSCKQETKSFDSKYSDIDKDKAMMSIKVVNQILGEIEIDHQQDLKYNLKGTNNDLININEEEDKNDHEKERLCVDTPHGTESQQDKKDITFEAYKSSNGYVDNERSIHQRNINCVQNEKCPENLRNGENTSGNMPTSLVVDIHIPPSNDGGMFLDEIDPKVIGIQNPNTAGKEDSALRPCKHEINRSQRCYSDTSQLNIKRKKKVGIMFNFT